jgi:hypothetical protein
MKKMSNTIREYESVPREDSSDSLILTSVSGGPYGKCMQFTIGRSFCLLSETQLIDLKSAVDSRLNCVKGYSATDHNMFDIKVKSGKRSK